MQGSSDDQSLAACTSVGGDEHLDVRVEAGGDSDGSECFAGCESFWGLRASVDAGGLDEAGLGDGVWDCCPAPFGGHLDSGASAGDGKPFGDGGEDAVVGLVGDATDFGVEGFEDVFVGRPGLVVGAVVACVGFDDEADSR